MILGPGISHTVTRTRQNRQMMPGKLDSAKSQRMKLPISRRQQQHQKLSTDI